MSSMVRRREMRWLDLARRLSDPGARQMTTDLLKSCGIADGLRCVGDGNIAWCSDWDAYLSDAKRPVIYIDAHHDVVCTEPIVPDITGEDIIVASWHDNRVSCAVLCEFISKRACPALADGKSAVIYCLFSDGEESGMLPMRSWYSRVRTPHAKEIYVVLDVTDSAETNGGSNLGCGAYTFIGDPVCSAVPLEIGSTHAQLCSSRPNYPDNLQYTHAGVLYRFGCKVGRMAVPVSAIGCTVRGRSRLHESVTLVSMSDIEAMYLRLCHFAANWKP